MFNEKNRHADQLALDLLKISGVARWLAPVLLAVALPACGGSGTTANPALLGGNPAGDSDPVVLPVTAPGLEVVANENFAGAEFVDIEKYNQAIENYNSAGSSLAGGDS